MQYQARNTLALTEGVKQKVRRSDTGSPLIKPSMALCLNDSIFGFVFCVRQLVIWAGRSAPSKCRTKETAQPMSGALSITASGASDCRSSN
mmetsp:Transcript_48759/g.135292  ORF Transcript_48759/g.135292 Transcript_48759/m.135292 type:complete len:91 (+) Transcript_48759:275-547(+)|eukprot:4379165-Prymnesium_polylepis.1